MSGALESATAPRPANVPIPARLRSFDVVRARFSSALTRDALAFGGLGALVGLLTVLTWGTWGDLGSDTGYDVVAGIRVADGQLPYVDFTYYYGPLAPLLLGLAGFVFGPGLGVAVGLGLALAVAIVAATYVVIRSRTGALGAFLGAAITAAVAFAPTNLSFVMPHALSASLAILAALAFLLAVARYADEKRTAWLVVAGTAAGVTALNRPEFAAGVFVAATLWLALRWRRGLGGPREAVLFAAPAVLIPSVVYGAFLVAVSPRRLLLENLYPTDELREGANAVLRIHAPLTASSFAELGGRLALYAAGTAALVAVAAVLSRRGLLARVTGAVLALAGLAVAAASVVRPEALRHGLQFAYGWVPAGAAIAVVLVAWRYRARKGEWTAADQLDFVAAIVLAILAAKTYAAFFLHSPEPQYAVYATPFAALLLVRLHLGELGAQKHVAALGAAWLAFLAAAGIGLAVKDARTESATVHGPGGSLAATPAEASVYQAALSWIEKRTRPGEAIVLAPQLTALYPLSERVGALPQLDLHPGTLPSPEDERVAIVRLESAGVRLAVIDQRLFPEFRQTSFGDSFHTTLASWLQRNFFRAARLRGNGPDAPRLDVWLRRGT